MSVATILALSFAGLVLVSVGSVLTLTVGANYHNTFDLIGKRATLLIDAMGDSLRAQMGRAEDATRYFRIPSDRVVEVGTQVMV